MYTSGMCLIKLKNILLTRLSLSLYAAFVGLFSGPLYAEPDTEAWVSDDNFNRCIQKIAKKHAWTTADDVTSITCHSKKIKSIAGIERFVNLEKLSLHKNNIREALIPSLPKLTHLNLARNALSTMTIAELPKIKEIYLFNNRLKTLEVSRLGALKKLKANANQLISFTYRDLPALEKIYLFDNQMEDIDIYQLPSLSYMDVRQNPMPDSLYEEMDKVTGSTILHDGNADDWK